MSRSRPVPVLAALGLVVASLAATSPTAGADPGRSGDAAAPPAAEQCDLRRSAHKSEHDEWAGCLGVAVSLASAPALGQTTTLAYEVAADAARPGATVTVEVPEGIVVVQAPEGASTRSGLQSDGTGSATLVQTSGDLVAGTTRTGSLTVRATGAGLKQLTVTVNAPVSWGVDAAADSVFVTVGAAGEASRLGGEIPTSGGVLVAPGEPAVAMVGGAPVPVKIASLEGEEQPHTDDVVDGADGADANTCVRGRWSYYDADGDLQPSINYQVQAWDQDSATEDDLLDTAVTGSDGSYDLCFDGADGEGGGTEAYVRFISSNSTWRVRNTAASNDSYVNTTAVVAVCDGCVHDFGSLIPGNDIHRGMHAFDSANDMWSWMPHACWDRDGACRQAIMNWTPTSTDGTYYSLSANDVHLAADDPNAPHTVVHELTHSTMDDAYDDDYPPAPSCNPHSIQGDSSQGCAWTEGFAEWVPAEVYNDYYYRWPDGAELNLETPTWGTAGWDTGDDTEGRVAGSLIDISDSANEVYWDRWDESDPGPVWDSFQNRVSDTFPLYLLGRAADGYDLSHAWSLAAIYQNTIDYGFRDPLTANVARVRRAPTPNVHNYDFDTTTSDWSAVAMRPPAGANYGLSVYDDSSQSLLLKSSAQGTGVVDFVAIDSNHRAVGDYYPRVSYVSGTGEYTIEHGANGGSLSLGSTTITMGSSDVVAVRDMALTGAASLAVRVVPQNGGQDPAIFLMASSASSSPTWVRSRSEAAASATGGGSGVSERLSYAVPATDTYGFVLVNTTGSGTYDVHADTSAPSSSVIIAGGAGRTKTAEVQLVHSSVDAQTGVDGMRVSVDGTMDSEPWVPYAGTSVVTLPGGDGTKTVLAQYRNRAHQQSSVSSDTIVLDRRADLTTTSVSKPPASKARGASFDVTDKVRNVGTNDAASSKTRYHLSKDKKLGGGDVAFAAQRSVGSLERGEVSTGTTEVTVKGSTPLGKYYVLACADGPDTLDEYAEGNNCKASKKKITIKAAAIAQPGPVEQ